MVSPKDAESGKVIFAVYPTEQSSGDLGSAICSSCSDILNSKNKGCIFKSHGLILCRGCLQVIVNILDQHHKEIL